MSFTRKALASKLPDPLRTTSFSSPLAPLLIVLVLIVPSLIFTACEKSEGHKKAVAAPLKRNVSISINSLGNGSGTLFSYNPKLSTDTTKFLTISTRIRITEEDQTSPPIVLPTLEIPLTFTSNEPKDEGERSIELSFGLPRVTSKEKSKDYTVHAITRSFSSLRALRAKLEIKRDGTNKITNWTVPKKMSPEMRSLLELLRNTLPTFIPSFPNENISEGASWVVSAKNTYLSNFQVDTTTEYLANKLTADTLGITIRNSSIAHNQILDIENPLLKNVTSRLIRAKSSAEGTLQYTKGDVAMEGSILGTDAKKVEMTGGPFGPKIQASSSTTSFEIALTSTRTPTTPEQ